jgi:hypothetical protein
MIQIVLAGRRGLLASLLLIVPSLLGAYGYLHGLRDHMVFIGIDAPRLVSASDRFIPRTGKALFLACSDSATFSAPGLTVSAEGPDLPRGCREVTSIARILPGQVFPLDSTGPFRFIAGELQVADITLPLQVARFALWAAPIMLVLLGCFACAMTGSSEAKGAQADSRTAAPIPDGTAAALSGTIIVALSVAAAWYVLGAWDPGAGRGIGALVSLVVMAIVVGFIIADILLGAGLMLLDPATAIGRALVAVAPRPAHPAGSALVYAATGALALAAFTAIVFASWFGLISALLLGLSAFVPPWAALALGVLLQ